MDNGISMTRKNTPDRREQPRRQGGAYLFIPAGILIGLGAGLLTGFTTSGVLVGLGLGFIGTALARARAPAVNGDAGQDYYSRSSPVLFALIGLFMICLGMSVVWTRIPLWPVIAAIFLVLLGGWLLVKGIRNQR